MSPEEKTQKICLLGSTGSIGKQVLDLVERSSRYKIINLACGGSDPKLISEQIRRFKPKQFFISQKDSAQKIKNQFTHEIDQTKIQTEDLNYLVEICLDPEVETIVIASTGTVALKACLAAIKAQKKVIIANKEILISAGELINQTLKENPQAKLIPADSEHVGIHQSLSQTDLSLVRNLYLTASGGPFFKKKDLDFRQIKVQEALNHPTWKMGKKITIDSATLMNKGFEIIEAHYLFGVDYSQIKAIVHPQSLIHSLVEFIDGNILAQLAPNDMRLVLQYALDFPERKENLSDKYLNLFEISKLEFYEPDFQRFRCLELAYSAGNLGQSYPAALVIADQIAVDLFLAEKINFAQIPEIIEQILDKHKPIKIKEAEDLTEIELGIFDQLERLTSF